MIHLLGFSGSALIIVSVTMRSLAWLRAFALAGSLAFVVYGSLMAAWPVVVTNALTTTVHFYHLRTLAVRRQPEPFPDEAPSH
jgi:uncharacterized membrane protein